jgi:hypothetical protein
MNVRSSMGVMPVSAGAALNSVLSSQKQTWLDEFESVVFCTGEKEKMVDFIQGKSGVAR